LPKCWKMFKPSYTGCSEAAVPVVLAVIFLLAPAVLRAQAVSDAEAMRAHGICFRLHDKTQAVAYYERAGRPDQADRVRREQAVYNRYVIGLFEAHFDFCPVRFHFTSDAQGIQEGRPVFLRADLSYDTAIAYPDQLLIMDYALREVGESRLGSERFFLLNSSFELRPNTFTTERVVLSADAAYVKKSAPLPFRADKEYLLPADVRKLNKVLYKRIESERP